MEGHCLSRSMNSLPLHPHLSSDHEMLETRILRDGDHKSPPDTGCFIGRLSATPHPRSKRYHPALLRPQPSKYDWSLTYRRSHRNNTRTDINVPSRGITQPPTQNYILHSRGADMARSDIITLRMVRFVPLPRGKRSPRSTRWCHDSFCPTGSRTLR